MDEKPALGVKPAWMVAWSRIGDLIGAIDRQYQHPYGDPALVEKWAEEIVMQCEIVKKFEMAELKERATSQ